MKPGNVVEWTSSAAGTTKTKRGVIIAAVPADDGKGPFDDFFLSNILGDKRFDYNTSDVPSILCRRHEGYLVAVVEKSKRFPRLYWPRVSALLLVEDAEAIE
jgi:hypothetical protein